MYGRRVFPNGIWLCSEWAPLLTQLTGCRSNNVGAETSPSVAWSVWRYVTVTAVPWPGAEWWAHEFPPQFRDLQFSTASVCCITFQLCTSNGALSSGLDCIAAHPPSFEGDVDHRTSVTTFSFVSDVMNSQTPVAVWLELFRLRRISPNVS